MFCPVCGEALAGDDTGGLRCEGGGTPFSKHLGESLTECYVDESRRPSDEPLRYRPGGRWFCPSCGVKAEVGEDFVRCPNCGRALNEFVYEVAEFHPHA